MLDTIKLDPQVPLILGGVEHKMIFNNRAVKEILMATGINLLTTALTSEKMMEPEMMGLLIYWGLKTNSPDITPEEVDLKLTSRHLLYYQTQIAKGLELFYPDIEDLPAGQPAEEEKDADPLKPALAHG